MKKFSLKKLSANYYRMIFGNYVLYISVDVKHKVLTVFFGDKSLCDKLNAVVMNALGHLRDVTDDFKVDAVCQSDNSMISLGNVKSFIV